MLARSAQGLYWMGRYLERAERMCRLLRLQMQLLVERPTPEIAVGWNRIYGSINREPAGGSLIIDSDAAVQADSFALADDLTFERSNPDSVWSCFVLGRENARQFRHRISAEMWTNLNLTYLRIQRLNILDIWRTAPENFYAETAAQIDTFAGIAEYTMYRDEGWSFMRLGRFIENAQLSTGLLLTQIAADTFIADAADPGWADLLRIYHAYEAYQRRYSGAVAPEQVLDLLVTDPLLPDSLCRSLTLVAAELRAIGAGPNSIDSDAARQLAGRLSALARYEWPYREDRTDLLQEINRNCRELHQLVTGAYFEYPIANLSAH